MITLLAVSDSRYVSWINETKNIVPLVYSPSSNISFTNSTTNGSMSTKVLRHTEETTSETSAKDHSIGQRVHGNLGITMTNLTIRQNNQTEATTSDHSTEHDAQKRWMNHSIDLYN